MTTQQEQQENSIPSVELCPISDLLSKRVEDMTEEELDQYSRELRDLQKDDRKLENLLGGKKKATKKAPVSKKKMDSDLSFLGL